MEWSNTEKNNMAENILDRSGRLIGRIVEQGNLDILLDAQGRRVGYYDHNTDTTCDSNGRLFARGDQLTRLL